MVQWMGIINLTPDSFYEPSRVKHDGFMDRVRAFADAGAAYIDIGAVSTRPGAAFVSLEEEWARLQPALEAIAGGAGVVSSAGGSTSVGAAGGSVAAGSLVAGEGVADGSLVADVVAAGGRSSVGVAGGSVAADGSCVAGGLAAGGGCFAGGSLVAGEGVAGGLVAAGVAADGSYLAGGSASAGGSTSVGAAGGSVAAGGALPLRISIDTTRSEIVRRAYEIIGPFVVNDISAGEDDPFMLPLAARLGLSYIAMHKRGDPQTMGSMCYYPDGVMAELTRYFRQFAVKAAALGLEDWILDPGLGFAKTAGQCWEILERLEELKCFGRPILIGAADKRFTRAVPERFAPSSSDGPSLCSSGALSVGSSSVGSSSVGSSSVGSSSVGSSSVGSSSVGSSSVGSSSVGFSSVGSSSVGSYGATSASDSAGGPDGTAIANALAIRHGADILRVHVIPPRVV